MVDSYAGPDPVKAVMGQYELAMVSAYINAALEATARTSKQLIDIARIFDQGLADQELAAIHSDVATQARRTIVASYGQTVGRSGGPSGYRATASGSMRRWSGGRLRTALGREDYLYGNAAGITLDPAPLDRAAVQWARLNFGARPRGGGSLPPRTVRFGDMVVAVVGLDEDARPAFSLPPGYWLDGEGPRGASAARRGQDAFAVSSRARTRDGRLRRGQPGRATRPQSGNVASKGIVGRNFLDQGVGTVALQLPRRYQIAYADLVRRGVGVVRPANVTISVTPGRIRRPSDPGRLGRRSF